MEAQQFFFVLVLGGLLSLSITSTIPSTITTENIDYEHADEHGNGGHNPWKG